MCVAEIEALGTLAAGTAHELATPLSTIAILARDVEQAFEEHPPDFPGAEDVIVDEDCSIEVLTAAEDYVKVKHAMIEADLEPEESDLTMRASANTPLELDDAAKVLRLVDMLESSDDVHEVYYNADIPEEAYD